MRVPIDEPQTTSPSPGSLKLRPLLSTQLQNFVEQARQTSFLRVPLNVPALRVHLINRTLIAVDPADCSTV
jgi:hypothetical protein